VRCSGDSEEIQRRCNIHDKSCDGDIMSLGHGRRVRLEEWVMHLRIMTTAQGMMKTANPDAGAQFRQVPSNIQQQVVPEQQDVPQHRSWPRFKRKSQKVRKTALKDDNDQQQDVPLQQVQGALAEGGHDGQNYVVGVDSHEEDSLKPQLNSILRFHSHIISINIILWINIEHIIFLYSVLFGIFLQIPTLQLTTN
jgi:hypothetical protein